jgi:hypothetical protein
MTTPSECDYCIIHLTQNQVTLVDKEDYELLIRHKWHAQWKPHAKKFYVNGYPESFLKAMKMHNFLMRPLAGTEVDHINRDPLDNRRSNLRIVTRSENCFNRVRPNKTGTPGLTKSWNRYIVRTIGIPPASRYLGMAATIEEGIAMQKDAGCIHAQ